MSSMYARKYSWWSRFFLQSRRRRRRVLARGVEPDEIFMDAAVVSRDPIGAIEGKIERPLARFSSFAFLACVGFGIVYLGVRGFALQVASGADLFSKSQENRFASRTLYAPRGILRDRNGEALVENVPVYGLLFDRTSFLEGKGDLNVLKTRLSEILGEPAGALTDLGFPEDGDVRKLPNRIFITRDMPLERMVVLAPHLDTLHGIEIFESFRRTYRDPRAFSHVLGYVGKVSPEEAAVNTSLKTEETVGKGGIELFYDDALRGAGGEKIIETDSRGIETNYRLTREPASGDSLVLTLDGALQETAYRTIDRYSMHGHGASAVVLDVKNGAVRALVSYPSFENGRLGQGLSADQFQTLLRDPLTPFFNRAIAGEFPSGSTIKPLIATAALEEHIIDPAKKIYDPGYIDIPNPYRPGESTRFPDWRPQGWVDMYDAIAYSANVYFYIIGGGYQDQKGLGISTIVRHARAFGLGERLGIDLPGEKAGLVPDPEWKKTAEPEDPIWRIGDTYHVSIGQGGVKTTPLQMAALTAAIANGGTLWKPYLMEGRYDSEGKLLESRSPEAIRTDLADQKSLKIVRQGMRETVLRGTARLLQNVPVAVAAKTGTAQHAPGKPPHAWVVAFAPAENPEIAVVVMVEQAGEGATVAVPITDEILRSYFSKNQEASIKN